MGADVVCACVSSPSAARRRTRRKRQMFWVQGLVSFQSYRTGGRVEQCRAATAQGAPVRLLQQQQARVQKPVGYQRETGGQTRAEEVRRIAGRRQGCEMQDTRVLTSSLFAAIPPQTLQEEAFGSRSGALQEPSRSLQEPWGRRV